MTAARRPAIRGRALAAVLLDLDDTVLDHAPGRAAAGRRVAALVAERHPDLPAGAVAEQLARSGSWFWDEPSRSAWGRLDLARARSAIFEHALEALGRPDPALAGEAVALHLREREAHSRLAEGALETLVHLRAAVPRLALVTNGAAAAQRAKIERFDLARYFDHVQIEGEFGAGKPDAAVYRHVLTRLGVAPEDALMVGDDFGWDVLGALDAGLHAAWIDAAGRGRPPAPAPREHLVLRALRELPERLAGA